MEMTFKHLTNEEVKTLRAGYAIEGLWFLNPGKTAEVQMIWAQRAAITNWFNEGSH